MTSTKIQYFVIQSSSDTHLLASNHNQDNRIFSKLRYYPSDLLQFRLGFDYFDYVKMRDLNGIQVLVLPIEDLVKSSNLNNLVLLLNELKRVCVFFFSYECLSKICLVINKLKSTGFSNWYCSIYHPEELIGVEGEPGYFVDHHDFYRKLRRDSAKLSKHVASSNKILKNIKLLIPEKSLQEVDYRHFKPMVSNVLNIYKADNFPYLNFQSKWGEVPLEGRQELMLQTLSDLDDIHLQWGLEKGFPLRISLPTLILVFPYHNPVYRQALSAIGKKEFNSVLLAEQGDNYTFTFTRDTDIDDDGGDEQLEGLANVVLNGQIETLDGIGFLHASFQFSPVLRFPVKSLALNRDLSLFGLGRKNGIEKSRNRYRAILKLGKTLRDAYLGEDLEEYLSKRNGQILAISDLPIEWMLVKGVPLGFLTDVCRIQDSNIKGFLNNYSALSKIRLRLGEKSLENTLVIFSGSQDDILFFSNSILLAKSQQKDCGFKIGIAADASQVKKLIERHRPQILIFDCHCMFDSEMASCYLKIGTDRIYGSDILKKQIGAPIVYLASCNTNPNYDNIEKLHDAFFQMGALCVTGTVLPIDMERGTFVYLRMLALMRSRNERLVSGNWLHFLSFSIRTSLIWEARKKCLVKLGRQLDDDEEKEFLVLLEKLHRFEDRATVFKTLVSEGLRLSDKVKLTLADTNMEFTYYTHYGRPDLILFAD